MLTRDTIIWRRLDVPGHGAALIERDVQGWRLSGTAVFAESQRACRLEYEIECDSQWYTRQCIVRGHVGANRVRVEVTRSSSGDWTIDGAPSSILKMCDDVDLEFSPATNLLPIRRLDLAVGETGTSRAAWIRFPDLTIEVLEQKYSRLTIDRYLYETVSGSFRRELIVDPTGFILDYPGLWRAEARQETSY